MQRTDHALLVALILSAGPAMAEDGDPTALEALPAVAFHVEHARDIAGDDFRFLSDGLLCGPAEDTIPKAIRTIPGFLDPDAPGSNPSPPSTTSTTLACTRGEPSYSTPAKD